jgi:hypothetical protein
MKRTRFFIYTSVLVVAFAFSAIPAMSQPNPPGPPGGGPPGDPGGGGNPHNPVPFSGLEILLVAGGVLGFRRLQKIKE